MADGKGILTNEQEKVVAVIVDDAIKAKGFLELIDGYLAKVLIVVVDDQLVDKLKVELKAKLALVAEKLIAKDWDGAQAEVAELLNALVDIPVLEEDAEGLIFLGSIQVLVGAILKWIASQKEEVPVV